MVARLVSLDGLPDIVLDRVLVVVGRHRRCEARLGSSRISRRHCCLALDRHEVIVRDLDSTNGTWINGRRVTDGLLRAGEVLSVAHLNFRLEIGDPSAPCDQLPPERGTPAPPSYPSPAITTEPLPETVQADQLDLDGPWPPRPAE